MPASEGARVRLMAKSELPQMLEQYGIQAAPERKSHQEALMEIAKFAILSGKSSDLSTVLQALIMGAGSGGTGHPSVQDLASHVRMTQAVMGS